MALLTKEQILETKKTLKRETVPMPEWGGDVLIQELSGNDRDELEMLLITDDGKLNREGIRAATLSLAIVDEKGRRMFSKADIEELGKLSGQAIVRLHRKVMKQSGLGENELEAEIKNSEGREADTDDSSSGFATS